MVERRRGHSWGRGPRCRCFDVEIPGESRARRGRRLRYVRWLVSDEALIGQRVRKECVRAAAGTRDGSANVLPDRRDGIYRRRQVWSRRRLVGRMGGP